MAYIRVIPRDLFNESKLLKCLGQLQLCIHDRKVNGHDLQVEFDGEAFDIRQNNEDGALFCNNYRVFLEREELILYTSYNSKSPYPLYALYHGEEYCVFDGNGKFMPKFKHKE